MDYNRFFVYNVHIHYDDLPNEMLRSKPTIQQNLVPIFKKLYTLSYYLLCTTFYQKYFAIELVYSISKKSSTY